MPLWQAFLAIGTGISVLVAAIKGVPVIFRAIKGFVAWADVQPDLSGIPGKFALLERGQQAINEKVDHLHDCVEGVKAEVVEVKGEVKKVKGRVEDIASQLGTAPPAGTP